MCKQALPFENLMACLHVRESTVQLLKVCMMFLVFDLELQGKGRNYLAIYFILASTFGLQPVSSTQKYWNDQTVETGSAKKVRSHQNDLNPSNLLRIEPTKWTGAPWKYPLLLVTESKPFCVKASKRCWGNLHEKIDGRANRLWREWPSKGCIFLLAK